MRIVERYSHLNGLEWMMVHRPELLTEIESILASVEARDRRTKMSQEQRMKGKMLYSPIGIEATPARVLPRGSRTISSTAGSSTRSTTWLLGPPTPFDHPH